jgi:hypothetical protein
MLATLENDAATDYMYTNTDQANYILPWNLEAIPMILAAESLGYTYIITLGVQAGLERKFWQYVYIIAGFSLA